MSLVFRVRTEAEMMSQFLTEMQLIDLKNVVVAALFSTSLRHCVISNLLPWGSESLLNTPNTYALVWWTAAITQNLLPSSF